MSEATSAPQDGSPFSREVGVRLRAVRRQRRLSLDEVERLSGGRWSASAIGAYERGFRNLSLPRLQELAGFYNVPMSVLLGEVDIRESSGDRPERIVLDLVALERVDEAVLVSRYAQTIVLERGDWNGRVLSVRRDDVRALARMHDATEGELVTKLGEWGALAATSSTSVGGAVEGESAAPAVASPS
jgi:transcriptional regulator with XRE-family HTH domain